MSSNGQIKILFLAADPSNATRLRLGQELRDIRERLQLARERDRFILDSRESVRPGDISQAIFDVEPQIVHFSGHGTSTGELCFEDLLGKYQPVQPDALAALFELVADQINCVLLNACYSEAQAKAIAQHISFVIGMNKEIGDQAAIAFAVGFYKALAARRTIDQAYKFGCVEIRLQGISEHLTPVLYVKKIPIKNTSDPVKYTLILSATINDIDRPLAEAIVAHLRQISGDASLTLQKIEAGSVKLVLLGSQEGFKQISALFREGTLTEILGIPIQEIQQQGLERVVANSTSLDSGSTSFNIRQRRRILQEIESLQQYYDLLSQKLSRLRQSLAIESATSVKFQLEIQIQNAEAEITQLTQQIEQLENSLQQK
ncbi:CHAT domain-containing protein [Nostoc sp. KVJ20]|uniref:CHAT domain-containing protein n=1 Tax=Nostoc sp. KVJ20 TaxID=457944 RepID=UPI000AFBA08A|nr:CHAT domain-containing protein [Nostoc sp. KVJ20]